MGLPAVLKNFLVSEDGGPYLGEVPEATLPKLTLKTDEYLAGGMIGPIPLDLGLEKLEMGWKLGGMNARVFRGFGASRHDATQLRFTGAYQSDSDAAVTAELVIRGRHTEIDPGTAKVGDKNEISITTAVSYLKWTVNGRVEVEIDLLGMVFATNGIDRYAEIRMALGLI